MSSSLGPLPSAPCLCSACLLQQVLLFFLHTAEHEQLGATPHTPLNLLTCLKALSHLHPGPGASTIQDTACVFLGRFLLTVQLKCCVLSRLNCGKRATVLPPFHPQRPARRGHGLFRSCLLPQSELSRLEFFGVNFLCAHTVTSLPKS